LETSTLTEGHSTAFLRRTTQACRAQQKGSTFEAERFLRRPKRDLGYGQLHGGSPIGAREFMAEEIADKVNRYLIDSESKFSQGSDEFFARLALKAAVSAFEKGNYGIGAVAVVRTEDQVRWYEGQNAMVTSLAGLIDHAETRALLAVAANETPDGVYEVKDAPFAGQGKSEISVYGTLEPCPLCTTVITHAGVRRSVSTCADGRLQRNDGYTFSDGAANVLAEKYPIQPLIWRNIQSGVGLAFERLSTLDESLHALSWNIFGDTRERIDKYLQTKPGLIDRSATRQAYQQRVNS
jgi:tRNA(Arg) A34 adenosine deaminase TadA